MADRDVRELVRQAEGGDEDAALQVAIERERREPGCGALTGHLFRLEAATWVVRFEEAYEDGTNTSWRYDDSFEDEGEEEQAWYSEQKATALGHAQEAVSFAREGDLRQAHEAASAALSIEAEATNGGDAWQDLATVGESALAHFSRRAADALFTGTPECVADFVDRLDYLTADDYVQLAGDPERWCLSSSVRLGNHNTVESPDPRYSGYLASVEDARELFDEWRQDRGRSPSREEAALALLFKHLEGGLLAVDAEQAFAARLEEVAGVERERLAAAQSGSLEARLEVFFEPQRELWTNRLESALGYARGRWGGEPDAEGEALRLSVESLGSQLLERLRASDLPGALTLAHEIHQLVADGLLERFWLPVVDLIQHAWLAFAEESARGECQVELPEELREHHEVRCSVLSERLLPAIDRLSDHPARLGGRRRRTPEAWGSVAQLPALEELVLKNAELGEPELLALCASSSLRTLRVECSEVSDEALRALAGTGLVELELQGVEELDLSTLATSSLRTLRLSDGEELVLEVFPALETLSLIDSTLASCDFSAATSLTRLEVVDTELGSEDEDEDEDERDSSAWLAPLADLGALRELRLAGFDLEEHEHALDWVTRLPLRKLSLEEGTISDSGLARLLRIPTLTELTLEGFELGPESCRALGKAQALERLTLRECELGEEGLGCLSDLPGLRDLTLSEFELDRDVPFGELRGLERLRLRECGGLARAWPALLERTQLEFLAVVGGDLAGFEPTLVSHPALRELRLEEWGPWIGEATQLEILEVNGMGLPAEWPALLAPLTSLRKLSLTGCESETDLVSLPVLPALEILEVFEWDVRSAAIAALAAQPRLRRLGVESAGLAADLDCLTRLPNLRELVLSELGDLGAGELERLGRVVGLERLVLGWDEE
ncbi:MAG: hypothetical protein JKY65_04470 [Planctomycetes bacterium]|nr:hypothetical protein [Planctomycetota bacterium]